MSCVLETHEITKRFSRITVLDGVSFKLKNHKITGLIGPNGSGKTTLMEIVAGLMAPDSGEVRRNGTEFKKEERREHLFYLPDSLVPYPETPVSQVCDFFCEAFSIDSARKRDIIDAIGLGSVLKKRVKQLSKGFRKRLCLALALWSRQPLLLLDEPFDGFDLRQTISIMEVLKDTCTREGRTLFLSIHQLGDAERICNEFLLLNQGKLIAMGNLRELERRASLEERGLEEVFLALT